MPKTKFPDRLEKYEVKDYLITPQERVEREMDRMYKYLRHEIELVLFNEDNLVSLVKAIRETLKDDDLKAVLHRALLRRRHAAAKDLLEVRANKAYWLARKRGMKEAKAQEIKRTIEREPYDARRGLDKFDARIAKRNKNFRRIGRKIPGER